METSTHTEQETARTIGAGSTTDNFLFHPFFNGDFCQRSAIVAPVTPNPPFLDPLLLHIRLPTLWANKYAFNIMHFSRLFHTPLPCLCWPRMA